MANRTKVLTGLVLVLLAVMGTSQALAADAIGTVTRVRGTAILLRDAAPQPIRLKRGMDVFLNDKIKTSAATAVRLALADGSVLSLGEKAFLTLDDFEFAPKKKNRRALFGMLRGKLRVFAKALAGFKQRSFKVKTPTAVCGVRGTVFLVWVQSATITKVVCYQDEIEVASVYAPEEYITLSPNQSTDVILKQSPTRPMLLNPDQLQQLEADLASVPGTEAPATGDPLGGVTTPVPRTPAEGSGNVTSIGVFDTGSTSNTTPGVQRETINQVTTPRFPDPPDPPANN